MSNNGGPLYHENDEFMWTDCPRCSHTLGVRRLAVVKKADAASVPGNGPGVAARRVSEAVVFPRRIARFDACGPGCWHIIISG
jgi:hypothetical protein